jgi:hypothetical protein
MKTNLAIILGVALGVIIISTALSVFVIVTFFLPADRSTSSDSTVNTPSTVNAPSITTSLPRTIAASPSPTYVNSTPAGTQTPVTSSPAANAEVSFNINITGIIEEGLTTRIVTAQLTNTGTADAHNTWVKIEAFSQGSRVKLNNQDFLQEKFDTIKAKQTITREVSISFNLFDAPKLMQNGVTLNLTINSDEKSQSLSYDYRP